MAKKTRTELSTLAINTNLPDNTTELITPTTERAQLTDERESVVNYKDDLGGTGNAGKFLTVAVDGESLTMVDAPTGDVTGTGTQYQLAVWDGTSALTGYAALTYINSILQAPQLRADSANGTVTINATDDAGGTAWLYFQNDDVLKAEISYFIQDDFLTIRTYQKDIVFERATNTPTLTIDGTTGDATFKGNILLDGSNQIHFNHQSGEVNTEAMRITRASDKMYFTYGTNAGDEAFYIKNDGDVIFEENVGIGTDSPSSKLHLKDAGTNSDVGIKIGNDSRDWNLKVMGSASDSLQFSTHDNSNVMTITSGGNVLFGTQGTPNGTSVYGSAFVPVSYNRSRLALACSNVGDLEVVQFFNPNGQVGNISTNGSSTDYNTSSDYRLKENVTPITDALSRINQLKPSRFNFIADADKIVDGFLAHEVQDIIPEAISGEKDAMKDEEFELTPRVEEVIDEEGNVITEAVEAVMETRSVPDYQGIDQSKIVPLLTAAIQEQQTIIADLITRLEALEA